MNLPFSHARFLDGVADYNDALLVVALNPLVSASVRAASAGVSSGCGPPEGHGLDTDIIGGPARGPPRVATGPARGTIPPGGRGGGELPPDLAPLPGYPHLVDGVWTEAS